MGLTESLLKWYRERCKAADKKCKKLKVKVAAKETFVKRLNRSLNANHVRLSKQYGGKLTGDAARRFLAAIRSGAILPDLSPQTTGSGGDKEDSKRTATQVKVASDEDLAFWKALCTLLDDIARIVMRARPLCDHEVELASKAIATFAACWQKRFKPGKAITPKQHMLVIDSVRFMKQWSMVPPHLLLPLPSLCLSDLCVYVCVCVRACLNNTVGNVV